MRWERTERTARCGSLLPWQGSSFPGEAPPRPRPASGGALGAGVGRAGDAGSIWPENRRKSVTGCKKHHSSVFKPPRSLGGFWRGPARCQEEMGCKRVGSSAPQPEKFRRPLLSSGHLACVFRAHPAFLCHFPEVGSPVGGDRGPP